MKKRKPKPSKSNSSKKHRKSIIDPIGPDLESIARELDTLARQRLPDRVLQGILTGYEAEIRQDSILLALTWYLQYNVKAKKKVKYPWHPARALAAALKSQKKDYLKELTKYRYGLCALPAPDETSALHPALKITSDWSSATIKIIVQESIFNAVLRGQVTMIDAAVATGVIVHGIPASEMAQLLGMTRVRIYQRLRRTSEITKAIIERLELPLVDLL